MKKSVPMKPAASMSKMVVSKKPTPNAMAQPGKSMGKGAKPCPPGK